MYEKFTVQPTHTITVDDHTFVVSELPPDIQSAVRQMDIWRQTEENLASDLLMAKCAINDVKRTLYETLSNIKPVKGGDQQ